MYAFATAPDLHYRRARNAYTALEIPATGHAVCECARWRVDALYGA
jgi:hypothetical protein